ncbi:MAG: response regulator [Fibrobacterales bacterium]
MYSVLIIDDDQAVRQSLVDFFEDCEWTIFEAASAEDALEIVKQSNISSIIVDLRLPGMGGPDFIRTLIKQNIFIPCLLCTGSPEYQLSEDFLPVNTISKKLFHKPVIEIHLLESELKSLIEAHK